MGYNTDFYGHIDITPALPEEIARYINNFSQTRHVKRDPEVLWQKYEGTNGFNKQYGVDGEYFVGDVDSYFDSELVTENVPSDTQPGYWCQWIITEGGTQIEWDNNENFYDAEKWMQYIIDNFIGPDYLCNGVITAQGESIDDRWALVVENNQVSVKSFLEVLSEDNNYCTLRKLLETLHESGTIASSEQLDQLYSAIEKAGFTLNSLIINGYPTNE